MSYLRRRYPACCDKAKKVERGDPRWFFCVCAWLEWCDEHGLAHIGTHD